MNRNSMRRNSAVRRAVTGVVAAAMMAAGAGAQQTEFAETLRAAQRGEAWAQWNTALAYYNGEGVEENKRESLRWFQAAWDAGDTDAAFWIAWQYDHGEGSPTNDREAARWYGRAAETGDTVAMWNLALMHEAGEGIRINEREAERLFERLRREGDSEERAKAAAALGTLYTGDGEEQGGAENGAIRVGRDELKAEGFLLQAARSGHAGAQNNLGVLYSKPDCLEMIRIRSADEGSTWRCTRLPTGGAGVPEDDAKAVRYFTLAADQGLAIAQSNLGTMYAKGTGTPKNDREAVRWFGLAAAQNSPEGQNNWGFMLAHGRGTAQDDREAVRLYRLADQQELAAASYNLGAMIRQSRGTQSDDRRAMFEAYQRAAEGGVVQAQYALGFAYRHGEGIEEDYGEAYRWFTAAARSGNEDALAAVGNAHANGEGVPRNLVEAYRWLNRARVSRGERRMGSALDGVLVHVDAEMEIANDQIERDLNRVVQSMSVEQRRQAGIR